MQDLGEALRALTRALEQLEAQATPQGMSRVEAQALRELSARQQEHGVEMGELVEALDLDQSNVSRLCKRLGERGVVARTPCHRDRRARRLSLTEEGEARAELASQARAERLGALHERLSDLERITIITSIGALARAIEQSEPT